MKTAGALVAGRYRLVELAASGGLSDVWRARDESTGGDLALKFVHGASEPGTAASLAAREQAAGRRFRHPNAVAVLDGGTDDGQPFLVLEWVDGPSLRQRIDREGQLTAAEVVSVGRAIAGALAEAHAHGVVHNDLKPENILFDSRGRPRLTDFGAAVALTETLGIGAARELMGTVAYMAPEVLQGAEPDARSDVYALGLVLFEAAAGRLPFAGATPAAVAGRRLTTDAPPLTELVSDAPPALSAALARALSSSAAARWPSAGSFATALGGRAPTARIAPMVRPRPTRTAGGARHSRRLTLAAVTMGAGAILVGSAVALRPSGDPGGDGGGEVVQTPEAEDEVLSVPPTATPPPPTATSKPQPTATARPPTATPTAAHAPERQPAEPAPKPGHGHDKGRGH